MNFTAYLMLGLTGVLAFIGLGLAYASHKAHERDKQDRGVH
jgi:hypothetical protein